jgi:hypothetical protein
MGFWENRKLVDLNDEILRALGGRWDAPPQVSSRWLQSEGARQLKLKAAALLDERTPIDVWGWKDPRTSLTLPFWNGLVPGLRVIICLRNPLDVAESLRHRDRFPVTKGLSLWQTYNQRLLASVKPEQRLITHYDAYFHDMAAELRRVLHFLEIPASDKTLESCYAATFSGLRHNQCTEQDLREARVSLSRMRLYASMCAEAGWIDRNAACYARFANSLVGRLLLAWPRQPLHVRAASHYRERGWRALRQGEYAAAWPFFAQAIRHDPLLLRDTGTVKDLLSLGKRALYSSFGWQRPRRSDTEPEEPVGSGAAHPSVPASGTDAADGRGLG